MHRVGIVGGGAAAAGVANGLERAGADVDVGVFEATGRLGGRAATRTRGEATYDYGANYVADDDRRATDLLLEALGDDVLVEVDGPVHTFDADGTVSPGRADQGRRWTARAGLADLVAALFGAVDADVHTGTPIEHLRRETGTWSLRDADGGTWGPFDAVCCTPPAPATAALLERADWDGTRRVDLRDAADAVPYRTIQSAVLGYPFALSVPYYGLVNVDDGHPVGWISREECKPGHVPAGETVLIVQASPDWSLAHREAAPEAAAAALADHAADVVGDDRLRSPQWTDHAHFRHALPDAGVREEPLRAAEADALYCAGDWVAGEARLHAALVSGLDAAEGILAGG